MTIRDGIAIGLLITLLYLVVTHSPKIATHEEWLSPELVTATCFTWEEAAKHYSISGEVLLEFMINQDCH